MPTPETTTDATSARAVWLVRAFETATPPSPLWHDDDRAWATRLARETTPAAAGGARFVAERARHALQRLAPRCAEVAAEAAARVLPHPRWVAVVPAAALLAGLLAERLAPAQRIELLASPVWLLVGWNLLAYLWVSWRALGGPAPALAWLAGLGWPPPRGEASALQSYAAAWSRALRPARLAAASALLHGAAAAFAVGLVAGLYLRGLVLDYRAGWQSTFLDAAQVHTLLSLLLAPASAASGVALPGAAAVAAMQLGPGAAAQAAAAPWIHLLAATVVLFVVLPRALLSAVALWRCRAALARVVLPLDEPYFRQLLREREGRRARVQVLPCALHWHDDLAAPLRTALAPRLGNDVELQVAPPAAPDDDDAALPAADAGVAERVLLCEMAATPEDEVHGRLLARLRAAAAAPLLLVVDGTAFGARFRAMPQRIEQRRALWRDFAARHGLPLAWLPPEAP